jgi:hypothetical protein
LRLAGFELGITGIRVLPPHADTGDAILSVEELVNVGVTAAVANAIADSHWRSSPPATADPVGGVRGRSH